MRKYGQGAATTTHFYCAIQDDWQGLLPYITLYIVLSKYRKILHTIPLSSSECCWTIFFTWIWFRPLASCPSFVYAYFSWPTNVHFAHPIWPLWKRKPKSEGATASFYNIWPAWFILFTGLIHQQNSLFFSWINLSHFLALQLKLVCAHYHCRMLVINDADIQICSVSVLYALCKNGLQWGPEKVKSKNLDFSLGAWYIKGPKHLPLRYFR